MKVLLEINKKKCWSIPKINGDSDGFHVDVYSIEGLQIEFKHNHWTDCDDRIEEFEDQILDNINNPEMRAA